MKNKHLIKLLQRLDAELEVLAHEHDGVYDFPIKGVSISNDEITLNG